ncbi:MAG TPA: LytR C-terminal domain-containing protein [Nocardioides sp.]|nr:LytR C-terminal domain-containing protein [Nocardioides sp.]
MDGDLSARRRRNQRGIVFPSPVMILSIVAVAMAGVAWVATRHHEPTEQRVTSASTQQQTPSAGQSNYHQPEPKVKNPAKPAFNRSKYPVAVFNNSTVHGLAARVSTQTSKLGWQVVGADNWYGTIPATTVYYPPQLQKAGRQLALDLGIHRTMPAVAPMRFDRLTLILTGPLPAH